MSDATFATTFIKYFVVAAGSASVLALMNASIDLPRPRDRESYSSFFKIRETIPKVGVIILQVFYVVPPTILFVVVALYADNLLQALINLIAQDNKTAKDAFQNLHSVAPELDPIILVITAIALFLPWLKQAAVIVRDMILSTAGVYGLIDDFCHDAAAELLAKNGNDYTGALGRIVGTRPSPPVPEEFANSSNSEKLGFQILWLAREENAQKNQGIRDRISYLMGEAGAPIRVPRPINWPELDVWIPQASAGFFVFLVLIGGYTVVIPLFTRIPYFDSLFGMSWPANGARGALIFYISQRFLGYLMPFGMGIIMLIIRVRRTRRKESHLKRIIMVSYVISFASFLVNLVYKFLEVINSGNGGSFDLGRVLTFLQEKAYIDIYLYSVTPAIALTLWYFFHSRIYDRNNFVFICTTLMGLWFALHQAIYEMCGSDPLSPAPVYQFIFGAWLTLVFFICFQVVSERAGNLADAAD